LGNWTDKHKVPVSFPLIVTGLANEHDRLLTAGLSPGPIEEATTTNLVRLRDPDDNLVVLA
jgi:hypothetical protein